MKLDRNINPNGRGKYALIKLRVARPAKMAMAENSLVPDEAIDFGDTPDTEFFVIRLKDKYAAAALRAYATAAEADDLEWAQEIHALANKASLHTAKKRPD